MKFSLFCLLFSACGTLPDLEDFQKVPLAQTRVVHNPYFSNAHNDHFYKAKISVYGKNVGGILALKKMNDSLWRTALVSEFGSTLVDISFDQNFFKLNYAIKKLDKKYIIATLVKDLRLLVLPKGKVAEAYENRDTILLKTMKNQGFVYCYFEKRSGHLVKIVSTKGRNKKVSVYFSNFEENRPKTIEIAHHNIRLNILLNSISQANVD